MNAGTRAASALLMLAGFAAVPVRGDIAPDERTADLPDSWLVLYNLNDADSVAWKDWYIAQWGIPADNTLGLDVAGDEKIHRDDYRTQIFDVVNDRFAARPDLEARIMGILVGYRVPGACYIDDTHPMLPGGGGWSISNNLQDLTSDTWYKRYNPLMFGAYYQTPPPRLTKAAMGAGAYLSARIDAPTLADAQALTLRARTITSNPQPLPDGEFLYHDYVDVGAPGGNEWTALRFAVTDPDVNNPPQNPWLAFDSDLDATPDCAMHFSYYRITGWQNTPWAAAQPGSRILAYAMNSWGATTVRSTTDHGGRFVPNALVAGQFAAAIGSTAEPFLGNQPDVSTLVWCLADGRTLGEAFCHANPRLNYMWEVVGDPLLRVPYWFGVEANAAPDAVTALGPDAFIQGGDATLKCPTLQFVQADSDGDSVSYRIQVGRDADFASPVVDFTSAPLTAGLASFTVGQAAAGGTYTIGTVGQRLSPGAYYWRVASNDGEHTGPWTMAHDGLPAFAIVEPTVGFDVEFVDLAEDTTPTALTVRLSFASAEPIMVGYATTEVTAVADLDYVDHAGMLSFAPGELEHVVVLNALADDLDEPDETFIVSLTSATDATLAAMSNAVTLTIRDDDAVVGGGGGGGGGGGVTLADADHDGIADQRDNCPETANTNQRDSDADGLGDACDDCPTDAAKQTPGVCGCGVPDTDRDGDLVEDCLDECPDDPAKIEPGFCGCEHPETCPAANGDKQDLDEFDPADLDAVENDVDPSTVDQPDDDTATDDDLHLTLDDALADDPTQTPTTTVNEGANDTVGACGAGANLAMATLVLAFVCLRLTPARGRP